MSFKPQYSIICIDFRKFHSLNDFANFCLSANLDLNAEQWYDLYLGKWLPGKVINKVWIDTKTLGIVAYETTTHQMIHDVFANFLNEMTPVDRNYQHQVISPTFSESVTPLTLDSILDKISSKGMKSLTELEIKFLDSQSKNG